MSEVKNNVVQTGLYTEEDGHLKCVSPVFLAQKGGDIFLNLIAY
jgi:hypothetical protein